MVIELSSVAALIGDVVGSRGAPDRDALHGSLAAVVEQANAELRPVVPLRITVGDEYQGCWATVGEALHASLWMSLRLAPDVGVRHGIGWGPATVLAEEPRVEDGPAWWAAREAIEAVASGTGRAGTRLLRTAYRRADGVKGPDPAAVNAGLLCRDHLVGSLSPRSLRLLRGTLDGRTQLELARSEGITPSAVSQRIRHDGVAVVVAADELVREVR